MSTFADCENGRGHPGGHSMARPRLGTAPYAALSVRLDPEVLPALDQYVTDLRSELLGARVDRGMALRRLVLLGLQQLGYLPTPVSRAAPETPAAPPPPSRRRKRQGQPAPVV